MLRAKFVGREALMKRMRELVPDIEKEAAAAQLQAADALAEAIQVRAPFATGEYRESIRGGRLASGPKGRTVGIRGTKDPNATGIFALYIWRFLEFGRRPSTKGGRITDPSGRERNQRGSHPGHAAQPHIFPTYRAEKKRIRRTVANGVNRAVRRARKK